MTEKISKIIIPHVVLFDTNLSNTQKILYGIIAYLSKKKDFCYHTNRHLSHILGISSTSISKNISKLNKLAYIKIKTTYDAYSGITTRKIYINKEI